MTIPTEDPKAQASAPGSEDRTDVLSYPRSAGSASTPGEYISRLRRMLTGDILEERIYFEEKIEEYKKLALSDDLEYPEDTRKLLAVKRDEYQQNIAACEEEMTRRERLGIAPAGGAAAVNWADKRAEILEHIDILSVFEERVSLEKVGREYVGLCPFHEDKNPSLHVDLVKGLWHCFGCQAGGGVYDFVMQAEKISFTDAIYQLGERAGVELPKRRGEFISAAPAQPTAGMPDTTDVANAYRFRSLYKDRVRYCKGLDTWLIWDGKRWRKDDTFHVIELALKVADLIQDEASAATDSEARKNLAKGWAAAKDAWNIDAFLRLARSLLSIRPEELDKATACLNVENGILDMTTGELTPHDPTRYITKLLPVEFKPGDGCLKWDAFLEERVPMEENREYLQRIIGYALSGRSDGKRVPFIFGSPDTGKSTFLETVKTIAGDYCQKTNVELILSSRYGGSGEGPTPLLRQLFGARMVIASEIPKGRTINDGIFKDLSGGDSFIARGLHEAPISDRPTHCLILYGNDKPKFKDLSGATANRMAIVGFNVIIPPEIRRDMLDVIAIFALEKSGILNWIIQGYQHYLKDGLRDTADVAAARREYETEQDVIQRFLGEQCEFHDDYTTLKSEIYDRYKEWCDTCNEYPESRAAFVREVIRKGYDSYGQGAKKLKGLKVSGELPGLES